LLNYTLPGSLFYNPALAQQGRNWLMCHVFRYCAFTTVGFGGVTAVSRHDRSPRKP